MFKDFVTDFDCLRSQTVLPFYTGLQVGKGRPFSLSYKYRPRFQKTFCGVGQLLPVFSGSILKSKRVQDLFFIHDSPSAAWKGPSCACQS